MLSNSLGFLTVVAGSIFSIKSPSCFDCGLAFRTIYYIFPNSGFHHMNYIMDNGSSSNRTFSYNFPGANLILAAPHTLIYGVFRTLLFLSNRS